MKRAPRPCVFPLVALRDRRRSPDHALGERVLDLAWLVLTQPRGPRPEDARSLARSTDIPWSSGELRPEARTAEQTGPPEWPTLDRMVWPTDLRRALAAAAYLSLLATPASCARTREVKIPTVSGVGAGRQIEGHGKAAVTRIRVLRARASLKREGAIVETRPLEATQPGRGSPAP